MSKRFTGLYTADGMDFGDGRARILHHAKHNIGKRFVLEDLEADSKNARGFFEGAVIPLWVYLDGHDHQDSVKQKQYHDEAKKEFCPEVLIIAGKQTIQGGSTKGKLNGEHGVTNKVIDFLEEQYGIDRTQVLMPKEYKKWRDSIRPFEGPEDYISYLRLIKKLK